MVVASFLLLASSYAAQADYKGPEAFLSRPDIHGDMIAFSAEGDIWIADAKTGEARCLTNDPGVETNPRFSPDGTQLAYTASYDGGANVYVIPVEGGVPKRLTYDSMGAITLGWTPDGKVLFRSASKLYTSYVEAFSTNQLFTVSPKGGMPTMLKVPKGQFASMNADGHTLAFVPTSNEWMNWFRYEAGEADKIWLSDLSTGKFTQLTNSNGVDTQPTWAGSSIYFVSERSGIRNLWKLDPATKSAKPITSSKDHPVRWPSSDGKKVVFEMGARIAVYDPESGHTSVVPIHLHSDHIHSRPYEVPVAPTDGAGIGPSGKRIAIATRGHLVTVPAGEGSMRAIAGASGQRIQNPAWSPDGKKIAYVSDAIGEQELYLADSATESDPKPLTKGLGGENGNIVWSPDSKMLVIGNRAGDIKLVDATTGAIKLIAHAAGPLEYDDIQRDFHFSPNSKWLAYSISIGGFIPVCHLYEVATGKSTAFTDPEIPSASPVFSPDGKYIYALQARSPSFDESGISLKISVNFKQQVTAFALASGTPSPYLPKNDEEGEAPKKPDGPDKDMKVEFAGLADRTFDMKVPAEDYTGMVAAGGRLILQSAGGVVAYDIAGKSVIPLAPGAQIMDVSTDGKKALVAAPGRGLLVIDTQGGPAGPGGAVKLAGLTVTVNPEDEWHQIFEETWRCGRDLFYDPNYHGVDWNAMRKKYEAQLPLVGSRDDLVQVQKDLISEFNTGHCYVGGPTSFVARANRQGVLGIDLVWDQTANAYKITHILKGSTWNPEERSPLAVPGTGVHEGDYLMKIKGVELKKDQDPNALLSGTVGLSITISVNSKPTTKGETDLTVIPIGGRQEAALRNLDWIESRKAYVAKASGGKIGYVYVGDMEAQGGIQFAEHYYPNIEKPAIIVDVRGNGGGNISGNLLRDLSSKVTGRFTFRAGGEFRREGWAPLGQVVALTDEWAFSDGEYFSEFFKRLKIGPLVGHRTGGGEVGSGGGYPLIDGGSVFIPNYGAWVPGEWIVEGRGAVPDVEVDQDPASLLAGKDPQLDKAIAIIMGNLDKHPFTLPQHPPFPVKQGGSRAGKN